MEQDKQLEQMEEKRYAYICEGVSDEDKLKKLGCLFVVPTGGKYIRPEIKSFIKKLSNVRRLVLVLDPDGPGNGIRKTVENLSSYPVLQVYAPKKDAIRNGKVGIAEMKMENLKGLIFPYVRHDLYVDENLSFEDDDFYDLGIANGSASKDKRMKLVRKYSLPYTSAKKVMDYLLMLSISIDDIKECLEND